MSGTFRISCPAVVHIFFGDLKAADFLNLSQPVQHKLNWVIRSISRQRLNENTFENLESPPHIFLIPERSSQMHTQSVCTKINSQSLEDAGYTLEKYTSEHYTLEIKV